MTKVPAELEAAQEVWMDAMGAAADAIPTVFHNRLADIEKAHSQMMIAIVTGVAKNEALRAVRKGRDKLTEATD